jgi:PilZ domain
MSATLTTEPTTEETRRIPRFSLNLPLKVEGKDSPEATWDEITRLKDISSFGAGFTLDRSVKRGRLLKITLPMPRQMRCYDFLESQYVIWGIVRRCVRLEDQEDTSYLVGVAFIGKVPPKTYIDDPSQLYDVSHRAQVDDGLWLVTHAEANPDESEVPNEDRRHSRYQIPFNVTVELVNSAGNVLQSESAVTENISLGGASVFTSLIVEIGEFVRITSMQDDATLKAIVRGKRIGPDGIPRLHIEFVDQFFPLSGIDL